MNAFVLGAVGVLVVGYFSVSSPRSHLQTRLATTVSGTRESRSTAVIHVRARFANRSRLDVGEGRASIFGGPSDTSASGGRRARLALGNDPRYPLPEWLFLAPSDRRMKGRTYGQLRSLNPRRFYVAMRWPYSNCERDRREKIPHEELDDIEAYLGGFALRITAENSRQVIAWAVDYGPSNRHADVDLSPAAYRALKLGSGGRIASVEYVTSMTTLLGLVD